MNVMTSTNLDGHPFLGKLTENQVAVLSSYDKFDLIKLARFGVMKRVDMLWIRRV